MFDTLHFSLVKEHTQELRLRYSIHCIDVDGGPIYNK